MPTRPRILAALAVAALAVLAGCQRAPQQQTLKLYAGAGLQKAVDEVVKLFSARTGAQVDVDYAGSGVVMARAKIDKRADLFMPGDVWYVNELQRQANLVEAQREVSFFVPVIIVQKGNAKGIAKLADLYRDDVKVGLGDERCQIGRLSRKILAQNKLDVAKLKHESCGTVNQLGTWVKDKRVDVSIVWDAIAANFANAVDAIAIPPEQNIISRVVVAQLTCSQNKELATSFIDLMTSAEGRAIFEKHGYRTTLPE